MRLVMAGIDYKTAGVGVREQFSMIGETTREQMRLLAGVGGIEGCVLLSTCNRTELYLSCDGETQIDPVRLLCGCAGVSPSTLGRYVMVRREDSAAKHLMMVAAGLRSQIRGEDQILAQVKTAIDLAREMQAADAVLETLFRCAVSGAKKAKTLAPLSAMESSVARRAIQVLSERCTLAGKSALVIGNGEMGRLAAGLLLVRACEVTMTLRSYKRGIALIPKGCHTVPYEMRYQAAENSDILISATASPHFTVREEELARCGKLPRYLADLAVPRDIEPGVESMPGIEACWNVDTLGGNTPGVESVEKLRTIKAIVEEYMLRFKKWESYRACIPAAERKRHG